MRNSTSTAVGPVDGWTAEVMPLNEPVNVAELTCAASSDHKLGSGDHYKDVKHQSPDQCCQVCQQDDRCKSFLYFVTSQHHCYFFDNADDMGPYKMQGHNGLVSCKDTTAF